MTLHNRKILNLIDGALCEPAGGDFIETVDPSIGKPYALLPDSTKADLDRAVEAAQNAFPAWRDTPAEDRAACLRRLADLIEARMEDFVRAECIDNGKPLWLCRTVDIPRGVANLRFFASAIEQFSSEAHTMEGRGVNYTLREPIGVVATISPWNLPLLLFTWKFAPALAAGNCVIAKPSEVTPMTAFMLSELVGEAGFPPAVFNVLHGRGAQIGAAISAHSGIKAISFTGGTATGATIAKTAAPEFKKLSLELGGKNPTIVFDDADMARAMDGAVRSAFANQGQICLCGSRLLVQDGIYKKFRDTFVKRAKMLVPGDPLEEDTKFGATVSKDHMEKVLGCIEIARGEGGKILSGGGSVTVEGRCENGYFIEPTVIEGLPQQCRTNRQEIFGPVVTLQPFKTEDEALEIANDPEYGLAASVWTSDLNRAHRVARNIESGIVWVNCWNMRDLRTPFGGVKNSGVGREGGLEALRFFTEPKNVCINLSE